MKTAGNIVFALLVCVICTTSGAAQSIGSERKPFLNLINSIEEQTGYRFLYRESLVRDLIIDITSDSEQLFDDLSSKLESNGIGLNIDHQRKQVLLYELSAGDVSKIIFIKGFIVDDATGERLPYATVAWRQNGELTGTTSNKSGVFTIQRSFTDDEIVLLISYVGYHSETIKLNLANRTTWDGITIRLQPKLTGSQEITVKGITFYNAADSVFSGLAKVGAFSPLGEDNTIRALQTLPAVNTNTAINEGLNIRGSSADGFKVLLDGISIYSQSHLFGLLDSFNSDVLKSIGFFYDITPAQFEAPTGGTLSLITRTGSLKSFKGSFGLSNTSVRATVEGPVTKGKSSFLISGRQSYINEINWFNNRDLIEFGLNIDRPASSVEGNQQPLNDILIRPGNYDAAFYDLHAKVYIESRSGSRFQISGYAGEDDSQQTYVRCFNRDSEQLCPISFGRPDGAIFRTRELQTVNKWGNTSLAASYQSDFGNNGFSQTLIGFSAYDMIYRKDDFSFQGVSQDGTETILRPFGIENSLNEFKISQTFDFVIPIAGFTAGATYYNFGLEYYEDSFRRQNFSNSTQTSQIDIFTQADFNKFKNIGLHIGNRLHYFSDGSYIRWSPRLKLQLYPQKPVSLSMGYTKNHQFLNQIGLTNANTADLWIAATEDQPPTSSDVFSAGLHFTISPSTYLQVEGYLKNVKNMRLHELETRSIPASFNSDLPWYFQNRLFSQGLEFLLRQHWGRFRLTQTYTLSSVEIENPRINAGEPYHPDWDRRHQYYALSEFSVSNSITFNASWTFASGNPNELFTMLQITQTPNNIENTGRLKNYHRLDLSVSYTRSSPANGIEANVYLFNVTGRENVWYREYGAFVEADPDAPLRDRFTTIGKPVDVFDLGFQPSFNLKLNF